MLLKVPVQNVFAQLSEALLQLTDEAYTQPVPVLFGASIGQHVRHIIELFQCLESGYDSGLVNYEKRKRDHRIESDRLLATRLLDSIINNLDRPAKELQLEAEDYDAGVATARIPTNYYREIAYNLEHTIHHMALVRVGINEVSSMSLPAEFGVAYSTIKYRQQCAQ